MHRYLNILREVLNTGRAAKKASLLRQGGSPILRDILYYAYTPLVNFGVGAVRYTAIPLEDTGFQVEPIEFLMLCRRLTEGELVGAEAVAAVRQHIEAYPPEYRQMVCNIFAQKLRIGVPPKSINKIFPNLIPVFSMMHFRSYEPGKLKFPVYVSPRLEGMRVLVAKDAKGIAMWSKYGVPMLGVTHVLEAVRSLPEGYYDGVLMHPDGMQVAVNVTLRSLKNPHPELLNVTFHITDHVEISDWDSPRVYAQDRFLELRNSIAAHRLEFPASPLHYNPHVKVSKSYELLKAHKSFVAGGFIGTMVQGNEPYIHKKTYGYMELTEFCTMSARVISWELGNKNMLFENHMGRLHCEDLESGVRFPLGSGFEQKDRNITDAWVGKIVELKYSYLDPQGLPIHPIFICERSDSD
jgi:hypothetical protein